MTQAGSPVALDGGSPPQRAPCPVKARTLEDMLAEFRRNLGPATGRMLGDWTRLLDEEGPASSGPRLRWLQDKHGLGASQAAAIVSTFAPPPW